ncbi:MAG TPA: hypothetical protein VFE15_02880 [Marmoricola sp.]|nr:hypothetical protein [Marmoricola sp.]
MRSALADRRSQSRHGGPITGLATGLVAVVLALGLAGCSGNTSIAPPKATHDDSDLQSSQAGDTLTALVDALQRGDSSAARALGSSGSGQLLSDAVENVAKLHLVDLSLRLVDDQPASDADTAQYGPDAWQGTVEVGYRLRDWDTGITKVSSTFTFVPGDHNQRIAAIGTDVGRTPLWLTGPLRAIVVGRTLVIARSTKGPHYSRLAQRAISDVDKVLPAWQGTLVIEAPSDEQELDQALGVTQEQYSNIAAVTASVDGSLTPGSPVHVFINPRIFDTLGPRGSQVVISHESTHVATKAPFAVMPTWLLEGFADYVALAHAGIPVSTAASQILAEVRHTGAPTHLPTATDLAPTANELGATYEEAWLANRFISRTYGEPKLVAFYYAVNDGSSADVAFRSVLGTTQAAFVRSWRADVLSLSRGMAG